MASAGQLNKRVTFQSATVVEDAGGGGAETWGGDITVAGGFRPERGRERIEAGRVEAALAGVLKVRSSAATRAIDAETHRVLIDGEPYNITSVSNPDQRNAYLEMTVEAGTGAAV